MDRGFEFTVGREYQIFISNNTDKIIKVNFRGYYGIRKKEMHNDYVSIVNALWRFYFDDLTTDLLDKFMKGDDITVGEVTIFQDRIIIKGGGIFKDQEKEIRWENVKTKDYQTYFSIYSAVDSKNINRGYSYLNDRNTAVLYSVIRTILQSKNLIGQQ